MNSLRQPFTLAQTLVGFAALFIASSCFAADQKNPTQPGFDFFEQHIRPVLAKQCYECHSAEAAANKRLKAGLRLDQRKAAFAGGESGVAIVPGKPTESTLLSALKYEDLEMPPKGKLPDATVERFRQWIEMGSPWPETHSDTSAESRGHLSTPLDKSYEQWRADHWAWRPIKRPSLPAVVDMDAASTPVDQFIVARLESQNIAPSRRANRKTLVRRLYFDLIGLPPTFEQVDQFVNDKSPNAYGQLVDQLLASPHFGERWGRHWLDVARYADNGGWHSQNPKLTNDFHFAWTYRDYVIRSFNEDLPYDQFITQQLAADKLPLGEDNRALAATALLTIGDKSLGITQAEKVDDVVDTITRGMMGITVSCARCHDHKYDPIPTKDYYSLFAIFQNSQINVASNMHPIDKTDKFPRLFRNGQEKREFDAKLGKLSQAVDNASKAAHQSALQYCRQNAKTFLLALNENKDPKELNKDLLKRWREYLEAHASEDDPVWGPWNRLTKAFREKQDPQEVRESVCQQETFNRIVLERLRANQVDSRESLADLYGTVINSVYASEGDLGAAGKQLRATLDKSPLNLNQSDAIALKVHSNRDELEKHKKVRHEFLFSQARALAIKDNDNVGKQRVYIRGNPAKKGDEVPPRFLALLDDSQTPFAEGSGRLEFANAITASDNPLTARVIVNRIWRHHFGRGLVDSTSDFGTRSDPPTHPKLLDYLAFGLIENGWSLKWVHRQVLLSDAYQQSSADRPELADVDPENRLLARMSRRRLALEPIRDSLLLSSGQLDPRVGGPAEEPWKSRRRTIYGFINRYRMPDSYATFDFPNASTSSPGRSRTLVPQQALFLMNSEFAQKQAEALAERIPESLEDLSRIEWLYRIVLSRNPVKEELDVSRAFVESSEHPWRRLAQVLFMSNEFTYVD